MGRVVVEVTAVALGPQQNRIQRRGEESKRVGSGEEETTVMMMGAQKERPAGWRRARGKETKAKKGGGGWLLAVTKRENQRCSCGTATLLQETMDSMVLEAVGLVISFFSNTLPINCHQLSRGLCFNLASALCCSHCFTLFNSLGQHLINEISW